MSGTNSLNSGCGFTGGIASAIFLPFTGSFILASVAETFYKTTLQKSFTFSKLGFYCFSNVGSASMTFRKNAANGNQVATAPATTTGWNFDLSDSDATVANDQIDVTVGSGSVITTDLTGLTMVQNCATPNVNYINTALGSNANISTTKHFIPILGSTANANATENNLCSTYLQSPGTLSNLGVTITTASGGTITIQSRLNGSAGSQTLSIASGTGFFQDLTDHDAIIANDFYDTSVISTASSGVLSLVSYNFAGSTSAHDICSQSDLGAAGGGVYFNITGVGINIGTSTESANQAKIQYSTTASRLTIWANSAISYACQFRHNNINGNGNASASSTAGPVTDLTNSDAMVAGDTFDGLLSGSSSIIGALIRLNDGSVSGAKPFSFGSIAA